MGNTRTPRPSRPRLRVSSAFGRWIDTLRMPDNINPMPYRKVAELLGCSEQAVSNIRKGHYKPGRELANRIATASGGIVSAASWDKPVRKRAA